MKHIKWKSLFLTTFACLLPILLGVILWERLPGEIAIHYEMYNKPDNFSSKGFVVFGFPFLMAVLQGFCSVALDLDPKKRGENEKVLNVMKWIIPVLTIVLQIVTLLYALGLNVDIRRVAILIVSVMFFVIGETLPKLGYVKNYDIEPEKAKKINRFLGRIMIVLGALMMLTFFLPPIATVIWLILLIPYTVFSIVYTIKTGRKK